MDSRKELEVNRKPTTIKGLFSKKTLFRKKRQSKYFDPNSSASSIGQKKLPPCSDGYKHLHKQKVNVMPYNYLADEEKENKVMSVGGLPSIPRGTCSDLSRWVEQGFQKLENERFNNLPAVKAHRQNLGPQSIPSDFQFDDSIVSNANYNSEMSSQHIKKSLVTDYLGDSFKKGALDGFSGSSHVPSLSSSSSFKLDLDFSNFNTKNETSFLPPVDIGQRIRISIPALPSPAAYGGGNVDQKLRDRGLSSPVPYINMRFEEGEEKRDVKKEERNNRGMIQEALKKLNGGHNQGVSGLDRTQSKLSKEITSPNPLSSISTKITPSIQTSSSNLKRTPSTSSTKPFRYLSASKNLSDRQMKSKHCPPTLKLPHSTFKLARKSIPSPIKVKPKSKPVISNRNSKIHRIRQSRILVSERKNYNMSPGSSMVGLSGSRGNSVISGHSVASSATAVSLVVREHRESTIALAQVQPQTQSSNVASVQPNISYNYNPITRIPKNGALQITNPDPTSSSSSILDHYMDEIASIGPVPSPSPKKNPDEMFEEVPLAIRSTSCLESPSSDLDTPSPPPRPAPSAKGFGKVSSLRDSGHSSNKFRPCSAFISMLPPPPGHEPSVSVNTRSESNLTHDKDTPYFDSKDIADNEHGPNDNTEDSDEERPKCPISPSLKVETSFSSCSFTSDSDYEEHRALNQASMISPLPSPGIIGDNAHHKQSPSMDTFKFKKRHNPNLSVPDPQELEVIVVEKLSVVREARDRDSLIEDFPMPPNLGNKKGASMPTSPTMINNRTKCLKEETQLEYLKYTQSPSPPKGVSSDTDRNDVISSINQSSQDPDVSIDIEVEQSFNSFAIHQVLNKDRESNMQILTPHNLSLGASRINRSLPSTPSTQNSSYSVEDVRETILSPDLVALGKLNGKAKEPKKKVITGSEQLDFLLGQTQTNNSNITSLQRQASKVRPESKTVPPAKQHSKELPSVPTKMSLEQTNIKLSVKPNNLKPIDPYKVVPIQSYKQVQVVSHHVKKMEGSSKHDFSNQLQQFRQPLGSLAHPTSGKTLYASNSLSRKPTHQPGSKVVMIKKATAKEIQQIGMIVEQTEKSLSQDKPAPPPSSSFGRMLERVKFLTKS